MPYLISCSILCCVSGSPSAPDLFGIVSDFLDFFQRAKFRVSGSASAPDLFGIFSDFLDFFKRANLSCFRQCLRLCPQGGITWYEVEPRCSRPPLFMAPPETLRFSKRPLKLFMRPPEKPKCSRPPQKHAMGPPESLEETS